MHIEEFDRVALTEDFPAEGLAAGREGTVLDIYEQPVAGYAVEFYIPDGDDQYVLLDVYMHQVRLVEKYVEVAPAVASFPTG